MLGIEVIYKEWNYRQNLHASTTPITPAEPLLAATNRSKDAKVPSSDSGRLRGAPSPQPGWQYEISGKFGFRRDGKTFK